MTVIGTVTAAAGPAEPLAVHATVATLNPTANAVIRPVLVTQSRIHRTINIFNIRFCPGRLEHCRRLRPSDRPIPP